jgi:hypothetical protein
LEKRPAAYQAFGTAVKGSYDALLPAAVATTMFVSDVLNPGIWKLICEGET